MRLERDPVLLVLMVTAAFIVGPFVLLGFYGVTQAYSWAFALLGIAW